MKYNDIITVPWTDVRFVSSHRNVKFTIRRQPVWFEPRERVKNTHNAYELQLFFLKSVIWSLSFPLSLSLSPILHLFQWNFTFLKNKYYATWLRSIVLKKKGTDCTHAIFDEFTIIRHVNHLE